MMANYDCPRLTWIGWLTGWCFGWWVALIVVRVVSVGRFLANGYSFVFKFESLAREHAFSALERDLFNATGLPISVHLFVFLEFQAAAASSVA